MKLRGILQVMSERLEDVRPGQPQLSIDPVTAVPTPESNQISTAAEQVESRLNPEDERLPGNTGWLMGLGEAGERRWDQMKLAASTQMDRMSASSEAAGIAHARSQETLLTKRANGFTKREAQHTVALARINARSGVWEYPIARQISGMQAAYHGWRERVNNKKAARADAKATRMGKRADSAEKYKAYFDGKVATKVERVTKKWEAKADEIRSHRERIDARIDELGKAIASKEVLISKVRAAAAKLEQVSGGNRQKRLERLAKLYISLATEQAALENDHTMMGRARKHQVRLAVGQDGADTQVQSLGERYEAHEKWESPADPTNNTGTERAANNSSLLEADWSLRDLAESKGSITNEQVGKLWNHLFKNAKLPEGYITIVKLGRQAFPGEALDDAPGSQMTIRDMFDGLRRLYQTSEPFRKLVQEATMSKRRDNIDALLGRFETHIALEDNLESL